MWPGDGFLQDSVSAHARPRAPDWARASDGDGFLGFLEERGDE